MGECNCRLRDALAGEFKGCGKESIVRHKIWEFHCSGSRIARRVQRLQKEKIEISTVKVEENREFNRKEKENRDFYRTVKRVYMISDSGRASACTRFRKKALRALIKAR